MEYGFGFFPTDEITVAEGLVAQARLGDELGFDVISVSDHIVIPNGISPRYPYSETGEFDSTRSGDYLEQLTTLSFLGADTTKAKLLTSVMVLPYRSPVHTAKILATMDVLTNGRLIVGCGAGWMREEFEALGAPPFDERGAVTDEYIRAFKELWTSDEPTFDGRYCSFTDIAFEPKPVQKPHPPIWVGGESPAALRRAARLGDGWYPLSTNPKYPLDTLERLAAHVSRLRRYAEAGGRDPSEIQVAYGARYYNDVEAELTVDGQRHAFTGTPDQVADDIGAFEELGVNCLMFGFTGRTLEERSARMERFSTKVRPLVQA